jgi:two-component system, NtrC family, C4-dicarboxylate transport response regulator DctD
MNTLQDKSVLIIDDDVAMLRAMSKVLSREGMRVTSLSSPVAAIKELAAPDKQFDVVITDLRMPMFSGRGVLGFASTASPGLPVIIITAFGEPDTRAQAMQLGAYAFIEKPVAATRLVEVTTQAVTRSAQPDEPSGSSQICVS